MDKTTTMNQLGMVKMPEPDLEVVSAYGSSYGRYKPTQIKQVAPRVNKRVEMPSPDDELESLADFKSRTTM